MTQQTSPPGTTTPDDQRAATIAAIHAYADWLAANPDVPAPHFVEGTVHDSGDHEASLARTRQFADKYGAVKHEGTGTKWVVARVSAEDSPVKISHTIFVASKPRPQSEDW